MYSRLDGYLHARDVCQLMGINVSLDIALEAITKDSDHSGNDNATTKAKKGMGSNYERLEFLGDTFLKLVCDDSPKERIMAEVLYKPDNNA